jgi:hypothetical protein
MAVLNDTHISGNLTVTGSINTINGLSVTSGGLGPGMSRASYSLLKTNDNCTAIESIYRETGNIYDIKVDAASHATTSANTASYTYNSGNTTPIIYLNWTGSSLSGEEGQVLGFKNNVIQPLITTYFKGNNATYWNKWTVSFGSQSSTSKSISFL